MEFQLTKSQKGIQKAATEFAKGEFDKDLALDMEPRHAFPEEIRHKAADLGFIGIHWPETYEGGGLGVFENAIVAEAFCKKDSSIGIALMLSGFASEYLLHFGSEDLKRTFLPGVANGEAVSGAAFAEPGCGYDVTGITTTAVRDGGQWVVDGRKSGVLNGGVASFYCVLCRTDPDDASTKGISMIMVEAERDGLTVVNNQGKLGMRMVATTDLYIEGVRVPEDHLVGRQGQGVKQVMALKDQNRILTSAMALGTARGAYGRALEYVKQREQFGRKIGKFQVTQHKLAEMALSIEQAALMTYSAAWHFDRGKKKQAAFPMAKLSACRAALDVSSEAIQLLGGYGYMTEYEVERCYRDAKAMMLFDDNPIGLKDLVAAGVMGRMR